MKSAITVVALGLVSQTLAFPRLPDDVAAGLPERLAALQKRQNLTDPAQILPGGFTAPSLIPPKFDAKAQYIDTTGQYAFVPPKSGDQRGMCPGLNALANHGYLPHNGVATINQFIQATNKVYGMGIDLSTFLAVYGAVFDGDLTSWSIGGPTNQGLPLGFLTQPRGLDGSHNKYESDASPTRGDLYQYNNAWDLRMDQFSQMYALQDGKSDDASDYNLEVLTPFRNTRVLQSRAQNPYFFNAPFAGIAVQPAAYTFIWRFMSNKSSEYPEGRLSKSVLKSFFSVEGEPGSFKYTIGHERIPDNWYRRAIGDEYTIPFFVADVILAAKTYPIFIQVGGNLGKTNSFVGVDPSDLSGGVFNADQLLQGNNLFCFAVEIGAQQAPDFLFGVISSLSSAVSKINQAAGQALAGLGCPKLSKVNTGPLNQFPGYSKMNKKTGTY